MKRTLAAIAVFLFLGAAISVTLAWVFALTLSDSGQYTEFKHKRRSVLVSHEPGLVVYTLLDSRIVGIESTVLSTDIRRTSEPADLPGWVEFHAIEDEEKLQFIGFGWPLPCIHSRFHYGKDARSVLLDTNRADGVIRGRNFLRDGLMNLGFALPQTYLLPIAPIWSGFLINTLLLGFFAFVIVSARNIIRRFASIRRVRRNRCAMCGYDRRANPHPICPECGHSANQRPMLVTRPVLLTALVLTIMLVFIDTTYAVMFARNDPLKPIHYAAYNGDIDTILEQLNAGVAVDCPADISTAQYMPTPLSMAVQGGQPETVRFLLDAGADANGASMRFMGQSAFGSPLTLAAWYGRAQIAGMLIEAGAKTQTSSWLGRTPIHWAVIGGHVETVRTLIESGVDADQPDGDKYTPLHHASRNGNLEILRLLLQAGADVNAVANDNRTPLAVAAYMSESEAVRLLLDHGAKVTFAALQGAVEMADIDLLNRLIEHGGDLTARGSNGETLLFINSGFPNGEEMWQFLLDQGIDINATNDDGKTALDWALDNNMHAYAEFLIEHGAERATSATDEVESADDTDERG